MSATVTAIRTAAVYTHEGRYYVAHLDGSTPHNKQFGKAAKADRYAAGLEREGWTVVRGPVALELAKRHGVVPGVQAEAPSQATKPTAEEQTAAAQQNAAAEQERAATRQQPGDVAVPTPEQQATQQAADKASIAAERAKAKERAEKAMLQGFRKLVGKYGKRDEQNRTWLVDRGEEFYTIVRPACLAGVKWKDAMARLTTMLQAELGADMEDDLARAMQTYSAALHFGREDYTALPTRAQKSLASLFERVKESVDGQDTGVLVYVLAKLSAADGTRLFRWVMGEDKDTLPLEKPRYTTGGTLAGEDADLLTQALKRSAKEAADKASTTPAATNVTGDGKSKPAVTPTVAAEVEGKKGGKGKGPNAGAKATAGKTIVGEKPAVAAAALVSTLADYEKGDVVEMLTQAGKSPELNEPMIDALLVGIADRGDMELLLHICAVTERELNILDQRITMGGAKKWHEVSRQAAEKALVAAGKKLPKVG